jgi:F-box protein 42
MATINHLPNEVIEFILGLLAPYKDLKNSSLVCHRWNELVKSKSFFSPTKI